MNAHNHDSHHTTYHHILLTEPIHAVEPKATREIPRGGYGCPGQLQSSEEPLELIRHTTLGFTVDVWVVPPCCSSVHRPASAVGPIRNASNVARTIQGPPEFRGHVPRLKQAVQITSGTLVHEPSEPSS